MINIDPQQSISLRTSDFVESVQFIALETIQGSELSEIAQIESLSDRYIILDRNTSQILFFTKEGKFLKKISPDSKGLPYRYKKIPCFTIDRAQKKIYFNDLESSYKFEFNLDGIFLRMYPKDKIDYLIRESHYLNDFRINYFAYKSSPEKEKMPHNIVVFKDDALMHSYLPFNPTVIDRYDVYGSNRYFFESSDKLFFTKPYDETVYCFDDSGEMLQAFRFKFPDSLRIPKDFTSSLEYLGGRKSFIKKNSNKIYLITNFFQTGENLIFKLVGGAFSDQFIYDLSNKSLVSLTNYLSDSTTNFLPVFGRNIIDVDTDMVLSALPAKQFVNLINNHSKHGGNIHALPTEMQKIYNQGNDQNPILLLTKFKEEISYASKY